MAYREKVWNANVLTDLLSTYLTHKAGEREKYYQAEVTANKPQYKTVDGNLLEIDPRTGGTKVLYSKPREMKEPKFEDFPQVDENNRPTGMTIKGIFTGTDEQIVGVPLGYEIAGKKTQYKPDDPKAEEKKVEQKNISSMVSEVTRLRRLRDKDYDFTTQYMIDKGQQAPVFTEENRKQLDFYTGELANRGFDIYGKKTKLSKKTNGNKGNSELLKKFSSELRPASGKTWTTKQAKYYYSDEGKADIENYIKEFEQKYPPGTYDPYSLADKDRNQFLYSLRQKHLKEDIGFEFGSKYMDDIAEEYGRDGTLNNPATSGKKGSFWD
tara:strand:- start:1162 stop:2136 length:975 start_codon:yes stop_codon:yes gene_type:complete